jgi:DNA-directed RNA polymerase subunit M/transcription elongation factor TFIIS
MKCPKCHRPMERKKDKENVYFFQCPSCGETVGKPKEAEKNE